MPSQATYEDANLILRLYELRREEKLREARDWVSSKFYPTSLADLQTLAPMGSKENAYVRMVVSYWETASSFVTAGVLNQDLLFETGGELLVVWERIRELLPEMRAMFKNPKLFHNLETVGNAFIKHVEANGPEAYAAFQAMAKGAAAAAKTV